MYNILKYFHEDKDLIKTSVTIPVVGYLVNSNGIAQPSFHNET